MRIAYLTMQFPAPRETFACLDVRTLEALGDEVSVHCLRGERAEAADLTRQWGISALPVSQSRAASVARGLGFGLAHPGIALGLVIRLLRDNAARPMQLVKSLALTPRALDLFRTLRQLRPDAVHLFWGHQPALVGRLLHDHAPEIVLTQFLGAYDLAMGFRTGARLAAELPAVFTHAHANLPLIEAQGIDPRRVVVVHRGVDLSRRATASDGAVPHRLLGAGSFEEGKGFRELIEVFARVKQRHPDASLTLLGDGPERSSLEALVRERGLGAVAMPGFVPHDRVLAEMAAAEVFVSLSRMGGERLPNVIKEAMLHRCLCVSSRTVGIEELLTDGEHGFVVDARDVEGAAARIGQVFDDPELRERLVTAASTHLQEHFDVRRTMERYREVWRRLGAGEAA